MKQKRAERVERRRPLVEINLVSDSWPRASTAKRRRGCLSFLTPGLLILAALGAYAVGLR